MGRRPAAARRRRGGARSSFGCASNAGARGGVFYAIKLLLLFLQEPALAGGLRTARNRYERRAAEAGRLAPALAEKMARFPQWCETLRRELANGRPPNAAAVLEQLRDITPTAAPAGRRADAAWLACDCAGVLLLYPVIWRLGWVRLYLDPAFGPRAFQALVAGAVMRLLRPWRPGERLELAPALLAGMTAEADRLGVAQALAQTPLEALDLFPQAQDWPAALDAAADALDASLRCAHPRLSKGEPRDRGAAFHASAGPRSHRRKRAARRARAERLEHRPPHLRRRRRDRRRRMVGGPLRRLRPGGLVMDARSGFSDSTSHIRAELAYLDLLLRRALAIARANRPATDPQAFHGLLITDEAVDRVIDFTERGEEDASRIAKLDAEIDAKRKENKTLVELSPGGGSTLSLVRLAQRCGLEAVEKDILLIALAAELDARYETIYAYLQDDVTRARPEVALALTLLCDSFEERNAMRALFAPSAPILRMRLLELGESAHDRRPTLLRRFMKLDESALAFLLEQRL